jgi:hypothetical protein
MKGIMKYAVSTLLTNCKLGTHLLCLEILEAENADMAVGYEPVAAVWRHPRMVAVHHAMADAAAGGSKAG